MEGAATTTATATHQNMMNYQHHGSVSSNNHFRDLKINDNMQGDGYLVRNQIELKNGKAQKTGQFRHQSNAVKYYRYFGLNGAWFFLVDAIANWDNLFAMIFITTIFIAGEEIAMTQYFPIIILLLNIVVQASINMIADLKIKNACKAVNQRTVQKYVVTQRKAKQFQARSWESIFPGDIIKIKENEEFPADVLILDSINSTNDHKCYVRGGFTDDFSIPTVKKSHEGTYNKTGMKMSATKFVDQISGLVKYEYNYNGYFSGTFKLSNNPVALSISLENVIVKGSYLCQTKSVICLVLNVESQSMGNFDKGLLLNFNNITFSNIFAPQSTLLSFFQTKKPIFERQFYKSMRILQVIFMVLHVIVASITFFQLKLSETKMQHKFVKNISLLFSVNESTTESEFPLYFQQIFACTSGLFISLPLNFKIMMDIITIISANFAEWDYNVIPAGLKMNKAYAVKALGNITNIFMSKNAVINTNVKKAKILQIKAAWYFDKESAQSLDEQSFGGNTSTHSEFLGQQPHPQSSFAQKPSLFSKANNDKTGKAQQQSSFRNYQFPFARKPNVEVQKKSAQEETSSLESVTIPEVVRMPSGIPNNNRSIDEEDIDEEYLPNCFTYSHKFHNKKVRQDMQNPRKKEQLSEMLKAIVICHHATRREVSSGSKSLYKSIHSEEESHLMLAHSYDYQFLHRHNKTISIGICRDQKLRFDVMVNHSFSIMDQLITVTVIRPLILNNQDTYLHGATLFAKGPMSAMLQFLNDQHGDENNPGACQQYFEDMKRYADYGIFPTMYVRKELNSDEAADLESKINDAMSLVKDQDDKIESSLMYQMTELQVLGVVGTQEIFNPRDTMVIEDLIKNGVRVWLLSKDDEITHTVNCNAMRLLTAESNPLIINGDNEKDIEDQVKRCLATFTDGQEFDNKGKLKYSFTQTLNQKSHSSLQNDEILVNGKAQKNKPQKSNEDKQPSDDLFKKKKILMISGQALSFIFRDESLLKCFLTISTFCDLILGSSIRSNHFVELVKYSKHFTLDGTHQYTMAIISSAQEQQVMNEADVSIVLSTRMQKLTQLQIRADIVMNSLYPLTYLMFKHGTLCQRRINAAAKVILYRSFFLVLVIGTYMGIMCFSGSLPIKNLMLIMFIVLVSPIQIVLYGFSYRDIGFDYFYRIYGEYQRNLMVNIFSRYDIIKMFTYAFIDAFVYYLITFNTITIVLPQNGRVLNADGLQLYQGIVLYMFLTFQLTNHCEIVHFYHVAFFFMNILGIIFILDDEYLIGLKQFTGCPILLVHLLFVFLYCILRNYFVDVCRKLVCTKSQKRFDFYTEIEDRLFLEEYEDPNQEFRLEYFEQDYVQIAKKLAQRKMTVINKNLMKLPRSESLDTIIERLNEHHSGQSMKRFQDQAILNWFSLKFNDQNKEIEYLESRNFDKILKFRKVIIVTLVFNACELIKEITLSSLNKIPFQAFWFYFGFSLLSIFTLALTYRMQKKVQHINLALLIFLCVFYTFSYYYIDNVEFSLYASVLLYLFALHGTFVRLAILIALCFLVMHINLINLNFNRRSFYQQSIEERPSVVLPYLAATLTLLTVSWSLYIYWEEKIMRLEYWQGYKKIKEFSKLKSILHILMPAFVRERIRQGQRFIADDQGEVTTIFCDIAEFDTIVQMFTGRELCEWLDNIYNALDQLCEQNGLQKIETVGKTYMACGGLKQSEKKLDQRLLNKHHSVRVAEFSHNVLNFIRRQTLKDGSPVKVKLGMHSGNVISGVVGENKPQFSLIGDTINKTSRVCSKCKDNQILISKETYKLLEAHSNMYSYEQQVVDMKGIGREAVYYVRKRSSPQVVTYSQALAAQLQSDIMHDQRNRNSQGLSKSNTLKKGAKHSPYADGILDTSGTFGGLNTNQNDDNGRLTRLNKIAPLSKLKDQNTGIPSSQIRQEYFQGGVQQPETSRSLIYSDRNSEEIPNNPMEIFDQSDDEDANEQLGYIDGEDFRKQHNILHFGDFKDDRAIFKNAIENSQYNLIERPNYLLSFNQNQYHLEESFRFQLLKEDQWRKFLFFGIFCVYNKLGLAFFLLEIKRGINFEQQSFLIPLYVYIGLLIMTEITLIVRLKFVTINSTQKTSYLITLYFILMLCVTFAQGWAISNDSRLYQIYILECIVVLSFVFFMGLLQLRSIIAINIAMLIIYLIVISCNGSYLTVKTFSFAFELIFCAAMYTLESHQKEMAKRKIHNRKIIIDIEIKRTSNLLSNLVPPPVLLGIKNDQKVVDELEDVTLLFTDMVGFTQFSNNVKNPKEVVKLLSELFTRFDQLCVQNKVYKVHTIGDCYVILGYTGHIPQSQRTPEIKAEEAYRVVQTGFEMIDIIEDVRNHSDNPDLKDLNMRIGIHTGKIVAGIIGTKLVRYDIFGGDVLIANKMESHGLAGKVVVSEETKRILMIDPQLSERLDFTKHKTVELQGISRTVEAYIVKPREDTIDSHSSIESHEGFDDSMEDIEHRQERIDSQGNQVIYENDEIEIIEQSSVYDGPKNIEEIKQ